MITKQELKDLASYVLESEFFISLYLNVDPKVNTKDDWQLHFKNLARDALAKLTEEGKSRARKEIDKIEHFLSDRPEGMKRGLVIISCQSKDFWRVYHTAVPFKNLLIIDNDPYIKPIAAKLDVYRGYAIVVVGREKAQLYLTRMGEIDEVSAISRLIEVEEPARDGRTGDMGEIRAQRQMEKVRRQLLKETASALEKLLANEGIKRVLLGGSDKAQGHFMDMLSEPLKEKIVGNFSVDRNAGAHEVLERCIPIMKEVEHRFERKALEELFDQAGQRDGSVLGLSDVLTALQQGNVHKLYVLSNQVTSGMVCSRCGALTPARDRPCPYCEGEMNHVTHMLDLAIQKALDQGARVDMVEDSSELDKVGGIGAMLRY